MYGRGASASFGTKTSSLQAFVAIAKSVTAAQAAVRGLHAHRRGPAVAIGARGYTFQESALPTNNEIAWSSGRHVLAITVNTQGPRPELSRSALIALARTCRLASSDGGSSHDHAATRRFSTS